MREERGKLLAGCTCCPNACGPAFDPSTRLLGSDASLIEPFSRVTGAFTEKGRTEHLVFMDTCACNGCPANAYVLRPDGKGGYARAARHTVMNGGDCKVVHRKGQVDRALCARFMSRMGFATTTLHLYDFSKTPSPDETPLAPSLEFMALNDLILRCAPGATYVMRTLTKWELRDVDRDGGDDLVVDLAVQDGKVTKDVLEICSYEEGLPPPKGNLPKTRYLTLTWTATPTGFSPDAKTAKLPRSRAQSIHPAAGDDSTSRRGPSAPCPRRAAVAASRPTPPSIT